MTVTKPVSPDQIEDVKEKNFPDQVIESFNELLIKNFSGGSATIKQEDVVNLMITKGLNKEEIFENNWLDIERIYRSQGWIVEYDKPGFNESYEAFFKFKKPPK